MDSHTVSTGAGWPETPERVLDAVTEVAKVIKRDRAALERRLAEFCWSSTAILSAALELGFEPLPSCYLEDRVVVIDDECMGRLVLMPPAVFEQYERARDAKGTT